MFYFVIILSISLLTSQTTPTLSSIIHKIIFKRPSESEFAFLTGEDSNAVAGCSKELCDENKLMLRLASMKVISPERIVLMFTSDNLNDLCRKLGSNIDEVQHEFKSCTPLKPDNLYWMLFRGVESMYGRICNSTKPGKSLQNLLNNRDCIVELREEYIDCEGPTDWFEKENRTTLCEIYHDILNCQFVKTAELCGMEVAHSLRILTKTVFDGTLIFQCNAGEPPNIASPMPNYDSMVSSAKLLDATFDDVLQLALPRMPECLSGIVRIAIRQYVNLHNSELLSKYNGSILMIRRTEDEIISENMDVATNRCNNLVISLLKYRFPNIFKSEQIALINNRLSRPIEKTRDNSTDQLCLSLLLSYASENGKSYPVEIGENYTEVQKSQMAEYLVYKHLLDYKSNHCTPLPVEYFQIPWTLPDDDTDFVFT